MSTFSYLTPAEAVHFASDNARDFEKITGLKALSAERLPNGWMTRTNSGYMRRPDTPWHAHSQLDKFKVIDRVEWAKDAERGMAEVFYEDGTSDLISRYDFLCVERPV